jgi:hypothetical protein
MKQTGHNRMNITVSPLRTGCRSWSFLWNYFNCNLFNVTNSTISVFHFEVISKTEHIYFLPFFVSKIIFSRIRFEILTAVVTKISVFWDKTPYSPLKVNRRFGGTSHLHLQCWGDMFLWNAGCLSMDYMALCISRKTNSSIFHHTSHVFF